MTGVVGASTQVAVASDAGEDVECVVLALFDSLHPGLLRYAASFGLRRQDAEDVVQETFLALFDHLRRGRSRSNLQGWVYRVTHHLALTRRRVRSREDVEGEETFRRLHDPCGSPEEELLFGEMQHRVQRVFQALPERTQRCLRLRAEGLRYREIARIVGVSLGSVAHAITDSMERMTRSERRLP